MVEVQYLF